MFGASDCDLCFVRANDVDKTLEVTRIIGEYVGVVSNTDTVHTDGANPESKVGEIGCSKTGVNVGFKVS